MYLFFDTETGGLTPEFSLLTLSAILTDRDFNIVCVHDFDPGLYLRVKHANYVTHPKAMEVNGIDLAEHDEYGFTVAEAREAFLAFVEESRNLSGHKKLIPAGHNVPFDVKFLQHYVMPEEQWRDAFTHPALDTCAAARLFTAANKISGGCGLDNLRRVFDINTGVAHNAEVDNLAAIALAKKLVAAIQPGRTGFPRPNEVA
jgi:DNA polymerase III epsilon subunit-like protein